MLSRLALAPRALLGGGAGGGAGAAGRSLGAVGRVRLGGAWALRARLRQRPAGLLLAATAAGWALGAWALRACERDWAPGGAGSLGGALWLLPVTFLTVGYGDLVPRTAGGRLVCLAAGALGVCCTALLVAVVAERLRFSRAERLLYGVLQSARSARQVRTRAAAVLQSAWRLRRAPPAEPGRWRLERRLLLALEAFRDARIRHRKIQEEVEATLSPSKVAAAVAEVAEGQRDVRSRLERLERSLEQLRELLGAPRTPGPPTDTARTPGPPTDAPRTPGPTADTARTPGPPTDAPRTPGPTGDTARTPGPPTDAPRTPGPTGDTARTPGPGGDESRTPGSLGDSGGRSDAWAPWPPSPDAWAPREGGAGGAAPRYRNTLCHPPGPV
ncbi:intermediate conductance calcium-activated potassium channel protein 4 [Struthio camelus]|uniref:intermediate conductance calcium-activated potassium channel protein 4 n=1 Tax=Struthio camelus TaxID=8801 RepID=UPI003603CC2B